MSKSLTKKKSGRQYNIIFIIIVVPIVARILSQFLSIAVSRDIDQSYSYINYMLTSVIWKLCDVVVAAIPILYNFILISNIGITIIII